jgi:hypothetical protein
VALEELLATSADDAASGIESLLTPTDAAALRGELAVYLVPSSQDGLAPGRQGWWEDNCMVRPWGFDLARLLDDDGHLTLPQNRVPEVHAWLSEHL